MMSESKRRFSMAHRFANRQAEHFHLETGAWLYTDAEGTTRFEISGWTLPSGKYEGRVFVRAPAEGSIGRTHFPKVLMNLQPGTFKQLYESESIYPAI
jgi:hypothetical protein